jgi:RNA polymerase sigma-70 factor (ECF subfamily)
LSGAELSNSEVTEIHRRYGFYLRRRCVQILRDPALADDALQEAFVKIMRHGAPTRDMPLPLRWLYRVVDRCCLDHLRRGRRTRESEPLDDQALDPAVHPSVQVEVRDAVLKILLDLEVKEQEIALMAFVDGMTQLEISAEIGWSRPTVNKKLKAIRERAEALMRGPHDR